jgi:hypothetical protein
MFSALKTIGTKFDKLLSQDIITELFRNENAGNLQIREESAIQFVISTLEKVDSVVNRALPLRAASPKLMPTT